MTSTLEEITGPNQGDLEYEQGFDDGYEGRARAGSTPEYLQGYSDGQEEAEELDENDGWDWTSEDDDEDLGGTGGYSW